MSSEYVKRLLNKIDIEVGNSRATRAELAKINPTINRTATLNPIETDFLISRDKKTQYNFNPDLLQPEPDEEIEDINQYISENTKTFNDLNELILDNYDEQDPNKFQLLIQDMITKRLITPIELQQIRPAWRLANATLDFNEILKNLVNIYNNNYNKIYTSQVKTENDEKLSRYKKRLENSYLGKFNTQQLPNESDEAFYYRIQSYKDQLPNADQAIQDEVEANIKTLKNNLSKFLRPDEIGLIINNKNIVNDGTLLFLNSTWKGFYNYIKQNYSSISVDSFTSLLQDYVQNKTLPSFKVSKQQAQAPQQAPAQAPQQAQEPQYEPPQYEEPQNVFKERKQTKQQQKQERSKLRKQNKQQRKQLRSSKYGDYEEPEYEEPEYEEPDLLRDAGFSSVEDAENPEIVSKYALRPDEGLDFPDEFKSEYEQDNPDIPIVINNIEAILEELQGRPRADIMQKLPAAIQYFERIGVDTDEIERLKYYLTLKKPHIIKTNKLLAPVLKSARDKLSKDYVQQMIGLGIKKQILKEEFVPFGKFVISLDKLQNGILKVKYPNGSNHPKIRRQIKISSDFKNILMDILERQKFNERIFNLLDDSETEIILTLLKLAGLTKILKIGHLENVSTKELMNEYDVICGEIHAGNDNPELIKRAKQLIAIMIKMGKVSRQAGLEMILCL